MEKWFCGSLSVFELAGINRLLRADKTAIGFASREWKVEDEEEEEEEQVEEEEKK